MLTTKTNETIKMADETGNHLSWCANQVSKATSLDEAAAIADERNHRAMKTAIFCINNGVNKFGKSVDVKQKRVDLNCSIESEILAQLRARK